MSSRGSVCALVAMVALFTATAPAWSASSPTPNLSLESVNSAGWRGKGRTIPPPVLVKLQVLLDRAHASPGQIDGARGENTRKAIGAYRQMRGLSGGEQIDAQLWRALNGE